jgi:hypothetical protein
MEQQSAEQNGMKFSDTRDDPFFWFRSIQKYLRNSKVDLSNPRNVLAGTNVMSIVVEVRTNVGFITAGVLGC